MNSLISLRKKYTPEYLLLIAGIVACIVINYNNIFLDFWCDEFYSLKHFQAVPISKTLTDYHDVNNHIFFNLLCNIYLKITGQNDLIPILFHPERLRVFLLLIPCTTVWALWKFSLEMSGIKLALINIVLLLTTQPYYNFALQLRGYGLAILLVFIILRYLYRLYCKQAERQSAGMIALFIALLIYTNPSNFYFALALFPSIAFLGWESKQGQIKVNRRFLIWSVLAVSSGILIGLSLYIPMMKQLFSLPYSGYRGDRWAALRELLVMNTYYFISARYWPFLVAVSGIVFHYKWSRYKASPQLTFAVCCIVTYLAVYAIAFLRKDAPIARLFMPELPLTIMPVGLGIYWCGHYLSPRILPVFWIITLGICIISLPYNIGRRNKIIDQNNANNVITVNLFTDWYLHNFHPVEIIKIVEQHEKEPGFLLFCITPYYLDEPKYLDELKVSYYGESQVDSLTAGLQNFYLIANTQAPIHKHYPNWRLEKLNSGLYANNIYKVSVDSLTH